MLIHQYDAQMIYTGESRDIGDNEGAPPGWTRLPLPQLSGGEVAQFQGSDWLVLAERPPAPAAPEPEPLPPHITRLAFRNRFTQIEKVTMDLASIDNPTAAMAQRQQAAALRVSLADTAASAFIDLSRPDTRAGVQMLEAVGILAAGRALQILDAPVQAEERPL